MNKLFAETINLFINSENEKLLGASLLKGLGRIGQRLYKLNPTLELKNSILKIKKIIENL